MATEPIDIVVDVAEAAAKKLLHDVILKAVINKLVAAMPFLGMSFINPIFTFLVYKLADKIFAEAALMGALFKIDFKTEAEKNEYVKAKDELKTVLINNGEYNETVKKAEEEYKKRLAALIRLND